jgi:hypothetical protein
MATLHQQIVEKFLEQLAASKTMDSTKIAKLRSLLKEKKKPKAEDLVPIFSQPIGGDVE